MILKAELLISAIRLSQMPVIQKTANLESQELESEKKLKNPAGSKILLFSIPAFKDPQTAESEIQKIRILKA